jgi:hypothetical protein
VWRCNIRVIIIPLILAVAYFGPSTYLDSLADLDLLPLVMWMATAASNSVSVGQGQIYATDWAETLVLTSLTASMTVNAVVTGLIVLRIFKVFRVSKGITTSWDKSLGVTRGGKLRSIIFVIIESGMTLFAVQLARLVIVSRGPGSTVADNDAYTIIPTTHEMLNVIISLVIGHLYFANNVDLARV